MFETDEDKLAFTIDYINKRLARAWDLQLKHGHTSLTWNDMKSYMHRMFESDTMRRRTASRNYLRPTKGLDKYSKNSLYTLSLYGMKQRDIQCKLRHRNTVLRPTGRRDTEGTAEEQQRTNTDERYNRHNYILYLSFSHE